MPHAMAKGLNQVSRIGRRVGKAIRKKQPASRQQVHQCGPVEALEDRVLLSTYYVAKGGSDSNSGRSLNAPFLSIQRAASLVQPGDTVLIREGTYRETVTPARSGTSSARIVFKPYNGEKVTISGADVVSGDWSKYKGSVYKTTQSWDLGLGNNQVFMDGQMMIEARWPNTTLDISHPVKATIDKASAGSTSGTLWDSALQASAGAWNGALLHMVPGQSWFGQTGKVTSQSPGKLSFSYQRMSGDETPTGGDYYYLTGKFSALDAAGEWFRDPSSKQLYFWTPRSDAPQSHTVEAKRRVNAFDLRLRTNIDIQGLNLFAATITTSRSSGSIHISGINAKYVTHYTVMPGRKVPHTNSLYLSGNNNIIENSRIEGAAGDGIVVDGSNAIIRNNVITDTNYNAGSAAAILVTGSDHKITNNTIAETGKDGIKIPHATRLKILNNVIHDVMLQATDGGAIYTFGTNGAGTEIAYNRIWESHNNGYGGSGIMLDNGSSNYVIHHNVVWDVDHAMKMNTVSRNNKIYNNTLLSSDQTIVGSKQRDYGGSVFKNNIFSNKPEIGKGAVQSGNVISANPGFVNPGAGNFQLLASASVVNKGVSVAPYTNGYAGAAPDVGAYEYGRAAFSAGAGSSVVTVPSTPTDPTPPVTKPPVTNPPTTTPGPSTTPTPNHSARSTVQAEKYDSMSGVRKDSYRLTYLDHGDWVKYSALDFGSGVSKLQLSLAIDNRHTGGRIEVRTGGPNGKLHGTLKTKTTGGWDKFNTQTLNVSGLKGVQDIYLVFKGREGVANIDWIKFA